MNWEERIEVKPGVMLGKPVIKGTRLTVELIVDLLANGWTYDEIYRSYPSVTKEDIQACLAYASQLLHEEKVYPLVS